MTTNLFGLDLIMKCDNDYLHRDKGNVFSVCVKLLGDST